MPLNLHLLDNSHSNGSGLYSVMKQGEKMTAIVCVCLSELSNLFQLNVKMYTEDFYILIGVYQQTHAIYCFEIGGGMHT